MFELLDKALTYGDKKAIIDQDGAHSYHDLSIRSDHLAAHILQKESDLKEKRIAFMITPGFDYVSVQWAIWKAGGIAVPLCTSHPVESLRHTIVNSQSTLVIAHRLSTIRQADQILVIEEGQIAERGTHDELIEKQGRYYQLYTYQSRI